MLISLVVSFNFSLYLYSKVWQNTKSALFVHGQKKKGKKLSLTVKVKRYILHVCVPLRPV